jgi:hypothetical protein
MSDDRVWTYVTVRTDHDYPWTLAGFVSHRRDLSDLGEPYLSAVKDALALREAHAADIAAITGIAYG